MIWSIILWIIILISLVFSFFWINVFLLFPDIQIKNKKFSYFPKVTIAVPAYNEENNIIYTLKSLYELDYPSTKKEIIVIDDGSRDNTYKIIKDFKDNHKDLNLKLISFSHNKGKAFALNEALKKASGDFFVVMDADSVISKNALKNILSVYFSFSDVGAVISHIKVKMCRRLIEKFQWFEYIYTQFIRNLLCRVGALYITPGAFSLYPTNLIKDLGGFDPTTITEDFEMALRIKSKGYNILFAKDALSYTKVPSTWLSYFKQRIRWNVGFIENTKRYFFKFLKKKDFSLFGHVLYPSFIASLLILVIYSFHVIYSFISSMIDRIDVYLLTHKLYLFEFSSFRDMILTYHYYISIPLFIILILSFTIYLFAFKHSDERLKEFFVFSLYFIVYSFITLLVWIVSLIYYYGKYRRSKRREWLK